LDIVAHSADMLEPAMLHVVHVMGVAPPPPPAPVLVVVV
jgi:hypothetical protein